MENNLEVSQFQEATPENIQGFIEATEAHRTECQQAGRYVEAEMAQKKVAELKAQAYQWSMEELVFTHTQQREECEQAHIKQYTEFNSGWDRLLFELSEADH